MRITTHKISNEHQQHNTTTEPKLLLQRIDHLIQQTPKQNKMKFNWRANWELLLVLVIIVVGIVITTIAAIRSKDKLLLVLPDESGGGGGASLLADSFASGQVPPLPQTDFQLQQTSGNSPADMTDMLNTDNNNNNNDDDDDVDNESAYLTQSSGATGAITTTTSSTKTTKTATATTTSSTTTTTTTRRPAVRQLQQHRSSAESSQQRARAHNSNKQTAARHASSANFQSSTNAYDSSSTEPSVTLASGATGAPNKHSLPSLAWSRLTHGGTSRRNAPVQQQQQFSNNHAQLQHGPNGEHDDNLDANLFVTTDHHIAGDHHKDLDHQDHDQDDDDIHTTKSALATSAPPLVDHFGKQAAQFSLHGPYEMAPSNAPQQHRNHLNDFQSKNNKQQLADIASDAGIEDMMTSYSRNNNASATNQTLVAGGESQLFRDYNLAAAAALAAAASSNTSYDNAHLLPPFGGQHQQTQQSANTGVRFRSNSLLPFSVLLSDLIKLSRPNSGLAGTTSATTTTTTGLSQPANSIRASTLHGSVLQQLRSLPGPLLALLNGGSGNTAEHALGHDSTSEASQHYQQRVSMALSGGGDILSRSLRASTSASALPAFPAPKGTPHTWIPPTSGGSAAASEALNANADFVATNTAGFLRATNEPPVSSPVTTPAAASNNEQQQASNLDQKGGTSDSKQQQVDEHQFVQTNQQQQVAYNGNQVVGARTNQFIQAQPPPNSQQQQHQVAPVYNSRLVTDFSPLDSSLAALASPAHMQMLSSHYANHRPNLAGAAMQHLQAQQLNRNSALVDFATGLIQAGESAPKVVLANTQSISSQPNQQTSGAPIQLNTINQQQARHKRETMSVSRARRRVPHDDGDDKVDDNRTANDDDDDADDDGGEFADTRPLSIVRPDGKPVGKQRRRPKKGTAQQETQRVANHADRNALLDDANDGDEIAPKRRGAPKTSLARLPLIDNNGKRLQSIQHAKQSGGGGGHKQSKKHAADDDVHTASSGLMSKLLGTASNINGDELDNDELDNDNDIDDVVEINGGGGSSLQPADERRKNELSDEVVEFNNNNNNGDSDTRQQQHQANNNNNVDDSDSTGRHVSSGTTNDNQAYARRTPQHTGGATQQSHQQQSRSDVDFYGHPGEETRQLKYGILGSGNYEVVNGGIYPDIDESTAAVNSVANYVRKPSVGLVSSLLASGAGNGHTSAGGFGLPMGARLSAAADGPFMRGASVNSADGELIGLIAPDQQLLGGGGALRHSASANPLLELIDGGRHFFDSAAHSQPQRQHRQMNKSSSSDSDEHTTTHKSLKTAKKKARKRPPTGMSSGAQMSSDEPRAASSYDNDDDDAKIDLLEQHKSSTTDSNNNNNNPFQSYQISPSKKVTIFSDQDLDSAPSEEHASSQSF